MAVVGCGGDQGEGTSANDAISGASGGTEGATVGADADTTQGGETSGNSGDGTAGDDASETSASEGGTTGDGPTTDDGGTAETSGAEDDTSASSGGATEDTGTESTGDGPCVSNSDCAGDPTGEVCDEGVCVPCTPSDDVCLMGEYCTEQNECVPGCTDNSDCVSPTVCDVPNYTCVGCLVDDDCALGTICETGTCVPGCTPSHGCLAGDDCCAGACVDVSTDTENCGACGNVCEYPNATGLCLQGDCELGPCDMGALDCNGDPTDGCEGGPGCLCVPGATESCYTGAPGTEGVGQCAAGTRECAEDGLSWSACVGQVLPSVETCGDTVDNDCDGLVDSTNDVDNDGYDLCFEDQILDCCEEIGCSLNPDLINPGAYDVPGNGLDDDCDGVIDEPEDGCDAGLASDTADVLDFARALDLCQFTVETPPTPVERIWGVIDATLTETDGSTLEFPDQATVRPDFGANQPTGFDSLVVLSSGVAADLTDTNPSFSSFEGGKFWGSEAPPPADWYAANGDAFPNVPGCPTSATTSNDPVMLTIRVRVPTNAQSFTADLNFFSAEFPEYVCSQYTDMFVALLDSTDPDNPADKNIAVYDELSDGTVLWPLGVNLAQSANGLFSQCVDGPIGCSGTLSDYTGCVGVDQLMGTGFDAYDSTGAFQPGCLDNAGTTSGHYYKGGATGWLTMSGNVEPGEVAEIRLAVWDAGGHLYDSLVILDNWRWGLDAAAPGLTPG